jgi:hypothetical protein
MAQETKKKTKEILKGLWISDEFQLVRDTVNYGINVYKHIFLEYEHCSEEVISIKSNPKCINPCPARINCK